MQVGGEKGNDSREVALYVDQQFAKFGISKADFRLRTCRTLCGPADVRHAQLAAQTGLILANQGTDYFTLYLGKGGVEVQGKCTNSKTNNFGVCGL